ncbi:hypothetical protein L1887_38946 [Cichorium endivia]|nr:hypothetical protein L1887_38946 [Cichorium endivia]
MLTEMNRRPSNGKEWTEVRRRSNTATITTFFVSKIPPGVRREIIAKEFSKYGMVADVYLAGKKDSGGNYFAFVRFKGVRNAKEMEKNMQSVSIHENVRRSCNGKPVQSTLPPIVLSLDTALKKWLSGPVLVGDAHSLDHLSTFHDYVEVGMKTKYLGGVRLALEFDFLKDAKAFMENETKWREWFKRLWAGDHYQKEQRYERTAWLKITGLPLELWDEVNFSSIAGKFGKVTNPFDFILNRSDWSMGKVGVLTSRRRWINEEVTVTVEGKMYQVGVVEYTDDWSPFKQCPFDRTVESEEEDDGEDDDSEAISDTRVNVDEDEHEDGEFRPQETEKNVDDRSNGLGDVEVIRSETRNNRLEGTSPMPENIGVPPVGIPEVSVNQNDEHGSQTGEIPAENLDGRVLEGKTTSLEPGKQVVGDGSLEDLGNDVGPLSKLPPMGCFGPFPSTFRFGESSNGPIGIRRPKRRRADREGRSYSPCSSPNQAEVFSKYPNPIDLNMNPQSSNNCASCELENEVNSNSVDEVAETIAVGAEIGFQIEEGNELLTQIIGENGEQNVMQ